MLIPCSRSSVRVLIWLPGMKPRAALSLLGMAAPLRCSWGRYVAASGRPPYKGGSLLPLAL